MASSGFKFTKNKIDEHVERIGVDVRPQIEIAMEHVHITEFYHVVSKKYPRLFESLTMGPGEFSIQKKLIFPGKGEATVPTFSLSARGPVFMFPRRISALDVETDLPPVKDHIVEILKDFRGQFPQCQILRLGLVHSYIFDCSPEDSVKLTAKQFTRVGDVRELSIRFNKPEDGYNRIFKITPVQKQVMRKGRGSSQETVEQVGFGIQVDVDFNNIDMTKPLEWKDITIILHDAEQFHDKEAFSILNGEGETE